MMGLGRFQRGAILAMQGFGKRPGCHYRANRDAEAGARAPRQSGIRCWQRAAVD
jgi:hypothetical protein